MFAQHISTPISLFILHVHATHPARLIGPDFIALIKLCEWYKIMKYLITDHTGYTNMCYLGV